MAAAATGPSPHLLADTSAVSKFRRLRTTEPGRPRAQVRVAVDAAHLGVTQRTHPTTGPHRERVPVFLRDGQTPLRDGHTVGPSTSDTEKPPARSQLDLGLWPLSWVGGGLSGGRSVFSEDVFAGHRTLGWQGLS